MWDKTVLGQILAIGNTLMPKMWTVFFPKDISSQGSSKYLRSCISISISPYISIQHVSCQYVSFPSVSIQCVSVQYVSIQKVARILSIRIVSIHIQYVSHQYVSIQCISIQCLSIQKVCISRNGNVSKYKTYPCISLHQQEWQWVWVSLHVILYHCYSAGNDGNGIPRDIFQLVAHINLECYCHTPSGRTWYSAGAKKGASIYLHCSDGKASDGSKAEYGRGFFMGGIWTIASVVEW